jgi:hypothetical protein
MEKLIRRRLAVRRWPIIQRHEALRWLVRQGEPTRKWRVARRAAKQPKHENRLREEWGVESGDTPAGHGGAKMLMLVNRESGKGLGITLFESEEAMRRGDETLNAMSPRPSEGRTAVEFYEVPVQTVR